MEKSIPRELELKKKEFLQTIKPCMYKSVILVPKTQYKEKVLEIKRVTKVTTGGKRMGFRAVVVIGDSIKRVGLGVGRADNVALAIEKAVYNGKKKFICINLTKNNSIPYLITSSFGAAHILLLPASKGTGVIAGGSTRIILEFAGIKNILSKQLGAKNILNNAQATIKALQLLNKKMELIKK